MRANAGWMRLLPAWALARLSGRDELQRVVGNTGWLLGDRVLRMVIGLVTSAIVTRHLGPGQFGLLAYAGAAVSLVGALATLGLDGIVVRDLVRAPDRAGETMGTALALKAVGGALTMLAALAFVAARRPGDAVAFWVVAATAAATLFSTADVIDFWFQSRVESRYVVLARLGAFLVVAGARLLLVALGASVVAFAAAVAAEAALGALGLVVAYRVAPARAAGWRASGARARALLALSWPVIFSGLAIAVYMKIDMVMLAEMAGDTEAGVYGAATRVSELWYFIPMAVASSVAPSITAAKAQGEARYYARLEKLFHLLAATALAIAIPMTFLSTPLVRVLFGDAYVAAGPVLALHIWSALFVFLGVGQSPWTINEGLTRLDMYRTAAGAVVNVALNLVLIPRYGALGAAAATVVAYALSSVFLNAAHPRTRVVFRQQVEAMCLRHIRRCVA